MTPSEEPSASRVVSSHLYVDLNRLPLAAFGVCYSLCVIHPSVHYGLRVFRLLLQRKSHSADSHGSEE